MSNGDIVKVEGPPPAHRYDMMSVAMTAQSVVGQVALIQEVMRQVMQKDTHYGTVPGCGPKPTLLKPGAEKLLMVFHLAPKFNITARDLPGGHREYEIVAEIYTPDNTFRGSGVGYCSSMESKYRYRKAELVCPKCQKNTIIKGKQEYGGGWVCFAKKGGCGAKFQDNDPQIVDQPQGRVENTDPADQFNTILKMGKKRALVDAILTVTAASDIFNQDLEDMQGKMPPEPYDADTGEVYDQPSSESSPPPQNSSRGQNAAQKPAQQRQSRQSASAQEPQQESMGDPSPPRSASGGRRNAAPSTPAASSRPPMNTMDEMPDMGESPPPSDSDIPPMGSPEPRVNPEEAQKKAEQINYINSCIKELDLGRDWIREFNIACPGVDPNKMTFSQGNAFADHLDTLLAKKVQESV